MDKTYGWEMVNNLRGVFSTPKNVTPYSRPEYITSDTYV